MQRPKIRRASGAVGDKGDLVKKGTHSSAAPQSMIRRVSNHIGGGGGRGRGQMRPPLLLLVVSSGAKIIIIGTLASAVEQQKIRCTSGAGRDKGDLVSSSLSLSGHNKIKKGKHRWPRTYFTQWGWGGTGERWGQIRCGGSAADERQTGGGRRWMAADDGGRRQFGGGGRWWCENWLWSGCPKRRAGIQTYRLRRRKKGVSRC